MAAAVLLLCSCSSCKLSLFTIEYRTLDQAPPAEVKPEEQENDPSVYPDVFDDS